MNPIYAVLLLNILALGYFVNAAEKTSCYVCNQNTDPDCKDPFTGNNDKFIQECPEENFCRKMIQTVNGETSVVRQCAKELYKPNYEGCYKTAGKASQHICTCKPKDGKPCNTGFTLRSSVPVVVSILVAAILLN